MTARCTSSLANINLSLGEESKCNGHVSVLDRLPERVSLGVPEGRASGEGEMPYSPITVNALRKKHGKVLTPKRIT